MLKTKRNCQRISKPEIHRRNTGYSVDLLLQSELLVETKTINVAKLICGSEGTLALLLKLH
jgi:hypothetical protein